MVIYTEEDSVLENIRRKQADFTKKLLALTEKNGYQIIQTNGQRVYAPPVSKKIQPPPKGCEVFIGKLHKNLYEDELIPVFESIGPLYKFRLMLDFTERTRGYAFATYFNKEDAEKAIAKLNKYEIRPRLHIGVYKSVDNCRLFLGNLPPNKTRVEVKELLSQYVSGIVDIIMYPDYNNRELNRGFVFVEFEDHRMAAMARRQFAPENLLAWGQPLYVDWADPLPEVDSSVMAKITVLYLKNLPLDYNTEEIYTAVCNIIGSKIVKKVHKTYTYAFVHIVNRKHAEIAIRKLQDFIVGNCHVEVEWARPRWCSKKYRINRVPNNFCTSVPPNARRLLHQRMAELNLSRKESTKIVNKSSNTVCDTSDALDGIYSSFINNVPGSSSPNNGSSTYDSEYSHFQGTTLFECIYGTK